MIIDYEVCKPGSGYIVLKRTDYIDSLQRFVDLSRSQSSVELFVTFMSDRDFWSVQGDSSTSLLVCFVLFRIVLFCFLRLTANDTAAKLTDQFSQIRLICSTDKQRFA